MTYPTYQAAKIANPDSEIKTDNLGNFFVSVGHTVCNPADYCMTVKQFLDAGHKFVEGDFMIGQDGLVFKVSNCLSYNQLLEDDDKRYALKAKALEETKTYRYEKVSSFSFALKADFNAGILFRHNEFNGNGYLKCETEDDVAYAAANEMLYRRIEVTERELWVQDALEAGQFEDRRVGSQEYIAVGKIYDKLVNGKG